MPTRAQYAKIHIAKKETGLSDADYRALLEGRFGVSSAKELTDNQVGELLGFFRSLGWQARQPANQERAQKPGSGRPGNWHDPARNPMYRKLYALICHNAARNWSWAYVRGTARHMARSDPGRPTELEWLDPGQLHGLVAAMQKHSNRLDR